MKYRYAILYTFHKWNVFSKILAPKIVNKSLFRFLVLHCQRSSESCDRVITLFFDECIIYILQFFPFVKKKRTKLCELIDRRRARFSSPARIMMKRKHRRKVYLFCHLSFFSISRCYICVRREAKCCARLEPGTSHRSFITRLFTRNVTYTDIAWWWYRSSRRSFILLQKQLATRSAKGAEKQSVQSSRKHWFFDNI